MVVVWLRCSSYTSGQPLIQTALALTLLTREHKTVTHNNATDTLSSYEWIFTIWQTIHHIIWHLVIHWCDKGAFNQQTAMLTLLFRYELLTHIIESKCDCISLVFAPWMTAEARTRQTRLTWLHLPPARPRSLIARDRSTLASSLSVCHPCFIIHCRVANGSDLSPANVCASQSRVTSWFESLWLCRNIQHTTPGRTQWDSNSNPSRVIRVVECASHGSGQQ